MSKISQVLTTMPDIHLKFSINISCYYYYYYYYDYDNYYYYYSYSSSSSTTSLISNANANLRSILINKAKGDLLVKKSWEKYNWKYDKGTSSHLSIFMCSKSLKKMVGYKTGLKLSCTRDLGSHFWTSTNTIYINV